MRACKVRFRHRPFLDHSVGSPLQHVLHRKLPGRGDHLFELEPGSSLTVDEKVELAIMGRPSETGPMSFIRTKSKRSVDGDVHLVTTSINDDRRALTTPRQIRDATGAGEHWLTGPRFAVFLQAIDDHNGSGATTAGVPKTRAVGAEDDLVTFDLVERRTDEISNYGAGSVLVVATDEGDVEFTDRVPRLTNNTVSHDEPGAVSARCIRHVFSIVAEGQRRWNNRVKRSSGLAINAHKLTAGTLHDIDSMATIWRFSTPKDVRPSAGDREATQNRPEDRGSPHAHS